MRFSALSFVAVCFLACGVADDEPIGTIASAKGEEHPASLHLTEDEIRAVEAVVTDYFDAQWRDSLEGCDNPKLRVNINGQPEDGSMLTTMFYRCSGEIQWIKFEVCVVAYQADPTTALLMTDSLVVDDCDL